LARLPPVDPAALDPAARQLLADLEAGRGFVPILYRVMGHAPAAMAAFLEFTSVLREQGILPARQKELAILLVGHLAGAATIIAAHRGFGRAAGLSDVQIAAVPEWQTAPAFDDRERAMLSYVAAVTRDIRVDATTWDAVRACFSDAELAELTLVAACYSMVARFLEPLEIELDAHYQAGPGRD
jgi:alkylhydroperoxidase family enzyme